MRFTRAALLIGAALLPAAVAAQSAPPARAPAASSVQVQPIRFTQRTLANGLRVYAIRDTSTANVAVQVWYDVGSKNDPANRSGFAHMFEHLMFKSTRNLRPEQMDRLTEDVGGYNNASTDSDFTNYYEVVPANHLERLLFAEADRMATLVVEPGVFASERDVVKEELRNRVLAQPYGKLFYLHFPAISYTVHPYARSGIGSIADLDAATIDDIRAFHATYYRPDNAVLVVSGNFDPAQLDAWIDKYFAPIAKPNRPIPRVTVQEPPRAQAISRTVYEANTPLPALLMSFQLPPNNHPDMAALTVLDTILSGGDNSRLYQSLVYRDQLAVQADTFLDARQATGAYALYAIAAGGKAIADVEAGMRAEIARLRDTAVTAGELSEAKNELITAALQSRQTAEGKAFALANGVIIDGDPRAADNRLAALQRVTAADVQRVARLYLADNRASALRYLPATAANPPGSGDSVAVASTVRVEALAPPPGIVVHTPAPESERVAVPAPGAPVAARLPNPIETRLANGMRVVVVERPDLPLVTASIVAPGGGARDPQNRAGLASMTGALMTKGTTTRSATQIAQAVESLGGSIESGADWDGTGVSLSVKSDQLAPALGILADVARNPAFAQAELDRARAQALDGVRVQLTDPGQLSGLVASRAVFGNRPYGQSLTGTAASLAAITRDDVVSAYRGVWRPSEATLVLVGDIKAREAQALAERLFGDWTNPPAGTSTAAPVPPNPLPEPRVIVVDFPGAGQAGVVVARPGIARSDPGYYPASVANAVLGVGFSSRLNQEIRIKRGLAYGAGSALGARAMAGPVSAATQTKNETADEVVALIVEQMRRIGNEPVAPAEIATRQAVLIGSFGRRIETNSGIATTLTGYAVQSVPLAELGRFVPAVQGVDPAAVQAAARAVLDPSRASIVVVGEAAQFVEALRQVYPNLIVIPRAELDLDSAALRRATAAAPAAPAAAPVGN